MFRQISAIDRLVAINIDQIVLYFWQYTTDISSSHCFRFNSRLVWNNCIESSTIAICESLIPYSWIFFISWAIIRSKGPFSIILFGLKSTGTKVFLSYCLLRMTHSDPNQIIRTLEGFIKTRMHVCMHFPCCNPLFRRQQTQLATEASINF